MVTKNDITGDAIKSKTLSKQGRDNWDQIFGKKKDMWHHVCKKEANLPGLLSIAKGESCNWCGQKEDGTFD